VRIDEFAFQIAKFDAQKLGEENKE